MNLKEKMQGKVKTATNQELQNMSWDEMDKQHLLEYCKANFPTVYNVKFKQKFQGGVKKRNPNGSVARDIRTPFKG